MSFAQMNLNPNIIKALEACGYTNPTPIQAQSIPEILTGKDIVASAQTGTGKTAAFVLPALHRLSLKKGGINPRVLILTPTRELAEQITKAAHKYGKFLRFNIISLVGGMPYRQQLRDLSKPVDIVVATPGRLLDHMDNKRLNLSEIEMLILDEADRMLDISFFDAVKEISKTTPRSRQTLLFSATVEDKLANVIKTLLKEPLEIDLSEEKRAPTKIAQEIYLADNSQHKMRLLTHFLKNENIYRGIIFSATKVHADLLAKQLRDLGYEAAALHGDLKQQVRNKTVERLRQGKLQFIVATDVAARGIDIKDVTHVFNYDLPKFSEDYVHRIGRTGRAGKEGIAISFVLPMDARHLQKIERYIGQRLEFSVITGLEPTKRLTKTQGAAPAKKSFGKKDGRSHGSSRGRESYSRERESYSRDRKPASHARGGRSERGERDHFSRENKRERDHGTREHTRSARDHFSRDPKREREHSHRDRNNYSREHAPAKKFAQQGKPHAEFKQKPAYAEKSSRRPARAHDDSFSPKQRSAKVRDEYFAKPRAERTERAPKTREGYYEKPARDKSHTSERSNNPRVRYADKTVKPRRAKKEDFSREDSQSRGGRRHRNREEFKSNFKKNKSGKQFSRVSDGF